MKGQATPTLFPDAPEELLEKKTALERTTIEPITHKIHNDAS